MKRRQFLILLLLVVVLNSLAQNVGEAFYIYRNDGQFNAFLRDEVDSIVFSHYDLDSLYYDENVTQLIYTTDSLYHIPLASIDSVGFVQPKTIINSDVFPLTEEHSSYIVNADRLNFTMVAGTPGALRPKKGNIVVATADCEAFPYGIIARVESINATGLGFEYTCSQACYDEVFDQLVVYQPAIGGTVVDAARGMDLRRSSLSATLWNMNWTSTIEGGGTTTTLNVGDHATATVVVRKTLTTPLYFQLSLKNELTSGVDFNAKSTASISKELQIGKTITAGKITIPYTMGLLWLEPKLSLFGYFEEAGTVELNYSGHFNRTDILDFTYTQGEWIFSHTPMTDVGTDIASLSMEGSAEIGLKPQIDFSLNGQQAGFGLNARTGLKEHINFVFDITHLSDGGLYDAMRDSYCRTTIPWSVTVHANANIFSRYDASKSDDGFATFSHTFAPPEEPQWGENHYIFPLFQVYGNVNKYRTKAEPMASVTRTLLLPVQVGFSLLDKDNNVLQTQYASRLYQDWSSFGTYTCEFSGLLTDEEYIVRPTVKLFGQDVLASPSAQIVLKSYTSCPDDNHPHMIDLGLPSGTKWACCNMGAQKPEHYGDYYAWGEIKDKNRYDWNTYAYFTGYDSKDNPTCEDIGSDIANTDYDVVTTWWGAPWHMPTSAQCEELVLNCHFSGVTQNGVKGGKFTGPNGGTIFLPAAGYRHEYGFRSIAKSGNYWSSTVNEERQYCADFLSFSTSKAYSERDWRSTGLSVRPVR